MAVWLPSQFFKAGFADEYLMDTSANRKQPKLASDEEISSALRVKPKRKASERLVAAIVPVKGDSLGTGFLKIIRALLSLSFAVLITLSMAWLILVSTIAAIPKLGDNYLFVDRNAFGLGGADVDTIAYSTENNKYGLFEKVGYHLTGSINGGAAVRIVAGPLDVISTNLEGYLVVNEISTDYQSDELIDRKQLGDSYIVICLEGSCGTPGTLLEIPIQNAIGEITGIIKISGLEPYEQQ